MRDFFSDAELDTLFLSARFGLNAAVGYAQSGDLVMAKRLGSDYATTLSNLLSFRDWFRDRVTEHSCFTRVFRAAAQQQGGGTVDGMAALERVTK